MALVSSKVVETNRTELVVEVKGEVFTKAVDHAFAVNSKKITVPGFRKGKAPRAMIEKRYGKGIFFEDAVDALYPEAYEAAVKEAGLVVVDNPTVEITELDENGFTFKAVVTTKPVPVLGQYKGLSAVKAVNPVTDEAVDAQVQKAREQLARLVPVEGRKTQMGDTAVIDFEGFVDGVAFSGGKGENYALELGSNTFIPGFEEQVADREVGEEFDVNVTFPEEYMEASLAGKAAVFKCKVNAIQVLELPELDDEFAKDVSEFDTLAEYKADIKANMEKNNAEQADIQFDNALLTQVVEGMSVEIPECMIQAGINDCLNEFGMRIGQQGLSLDDFIRYTGQTREEFSESFRPQAVNQVKSRLALEAIAAAEGITVSDEEIEEQYAKMAADYNLEVDMVKSYVPREAFENDMLCRNAMKVVSDSAVALDAPAEEKPTPKKRASKKAEAAEGEEKPAPKKRATKKKAEEAPAEEAAEKPAPKKRTAKKKAADEAAE